MRCTSKATLFFASMVLSTSFAYASDPMRDAGDPDSRLGLDQPLQPHIEQPKIQEPSIEPPVQGDPVQENSERPGQQPEISTPYPSTGIHGNEIGDMVEDEVKEAFPEQQPPRPNPHDRQLKSPGESLGATTESVPGGQKVLP